MSPNLHLILNNVLSIVSIVLIFGLSLFTYLNGRKNVVNITTSLLLFAATIFTITHTIAINISDPYISRDILMLNLIMFIGGALQVHSALAIVGKDHQERWIIGFFYAGATALTIFFIVSPQLFLLPSVAKMYFPSYYVPGSLNILRLIFLDVVAMPYSVYVLIKAYNASEDKKEAQQYLYWAATVAVTYFIIFIPNFLVYDIQIDPIWGMLFAPLMLIPFLYGAVKYEMLNIKIVAKQAFFFALAVAAVGSIITLFNYANVWIQEVVPTFPLWITALISAVFTVTLSIVIWERLRKNDLLKYEFITTVTHKFRTPLTHIKWSAENLSNLPITSEVKEQLNTIVGANAKLVELTNLLVSASELEEASYAYHPERTDLSYLVKEMVGNLTRQFEMKHLKVTKDITAELFVMCDVSRIQFVLQTLIENAISYTHSGGEITVRVIAHDKNAVFSVSDTGIGITKDELSYLFSKFYRGASARSEDTEGMGIGLFMSKEIIVKHKGKIWAESLGEGKGSTFSFSLPLV